MPRWWARLPPSFEGKEIPTRHKLVPYEEYAELRFHEDFPAQKDIFGHLRVEDMEVNEKTLSTYNVDDCTAWTENNGEVASAGHVAPEEDEPLTERNDISEAVEARTRELSENGQPVSALVIGGASYTEKAESAFDAVMRGLANAGVEEPTQIWGALKKSVRAGDKRVYDFPHTMGFLTSMERKTNYICIGTREASIASMKGLAYWYEEFNVGPNDVFEVQGKIYTPQEAVQLFDAFADQLDPAQILSTDELNFLEMPDGTLAHVTPGGHWRKPSLRMDDVEGASAPAKPGHRKETTGFRAHKSSSGHAGWAERCSRTTFQDRLESFRLSTVDWLSGHADTVIAEQVIRAMDHIEKNLDAYQGDAFNFFTASHGPDLHMGLLVEGSTDKLPKGYEACIPPEYRQGYRFIFDIVTDPCSPGMGRRLVDAAIAHSASKGCEGRLLLHADNDDAAGFFRSRGFKFVFPEEVRQQYPEDDVRQKLMHFTPAPG